MSVLKRVTLPWLLWALAGCNAPIPAPNPGMANIGRETAVDRLVDIGGTNLYVRCAGAGTPAVVLEAGLGNDHDMVLIDAVGDDQPARFWSLIPEAQMAEFRTGLEKLPEGLDYNTYVAGIAEMKARSRTMGDKPLVVLTRGKEQAPPDTSPELTSRMLQAWHDMQAHLRHLSTNSIQLIAKDSGHFIHREAPQLVVSCVRAVVEAARARGRLNVIAGACASDHRAPTVQ